MAPRQSCRATARSLLRIEEAKQRLASEDTLMEPIAAEVGSTRPSNLRCTGQAIDFKIAQPLGDELRYFAHKTSVAALLKQLLRCHRVHSHNRTTRAGTCS